MSSGISGTAIVLSSSVLAALLTSVINMVGILLNTKRAKELEKLKTQNEFLLDRFKALQELRADTIKLSQQATFGISMDAMQKGGKALLDWAQNEFKLHRQRVSLFNKRAYYFDDSFRVTVENSIDTIDRFMTIVQQHLVNNVGRESETAPKEIVEVLGQTVDGMVNFEKVLGNCLNNQLAKVKNQLQQSY